jgi:hypothetical protein
MITPVSRTRPFIRGASRANRPTFFAPQHTDRSIQGHAGRLPSRQGIGVNNRFTQLCSPALRTDRKEEAVDLEELVRCETGLHGFRAVIFL